MSEDGHTDATTIANLRAAMDRLVAERDGLRFENDILTIKRDAIQPLLDACRVMYLSEMDHFRDEKDQRQWNMCNVDPSSEESHVAKERFLVECRKLWGDG